MIQRTRARAGMRSRVLTTAPLLGGLCAVAAAAATPAAAAATIREAAGAPPSALQPRSTSPSSPTSSLTPIDVGVGELANLELHALGLSSEQLADLISGLPGSSGPAAASELKPLIEALLSQRGATVGELLETVENLLGGSETPAELLEPVTEGATTPESLASLLGGLASSLSPEQLTGLEQILEKLIGSLSPTELEALEERLHASGSPAELAKDLTEQLGSGGGLAPLETLLDGLGSLLGTSGTQLAEDLGAPLETLAGDLGKSTKSLSESSGVSLALPSKEIFYVLSNGKEGLSIGVTPPASATVSKGGSSSSTPPPSTVTSTYTTPSPPAGATPTTAAKKARRVRIVRARVRKGVLTLVVKTPSAGRVSVSGKDVKRVDRNVGKAKRLSLKLRLTRAGATALHRDHARRHTLTVRVTARFKPTSGRASMASRRVRLR